ncbi:unnamed protein product [Linum tenue]|uniref:Uncharacterized protein n=1 Tax=Linum tenue TaxID=586396 RepID=A0AAV0QA08_9ROSI|nr:unnamed protein product [Linum tenue]
MDHLARAQETYRRLQSEERMKRKIDEVPPKLLAQLHPVQDHINFTLKKAMFKCSYECYDRKRNRNQEEVGSCVENCAMPEKIKRSLERCQNKYKQDKIEGNGNADLMIGMESCVDEAIKDNTSWLPVILSRLKRECSMGDEEKQVNTCS